MDHDRSDPHAPDPAGPSAVLGLDGRPRPVPGPFDWFTARTGGRSPGEVGVTAAALLAAVVAGWWFLRPAPAPVESALPSAAEEVAAGDTAATAPGPSPSSPGGVAATTTSTPGVVVQAAGAVAGPGVYRLPTGARVDDLVRAAGGLTEDADGDRVNLAAPLADGERIWVPRRGEDAAPEVVAGGGAPVGGPDGSGAPAGPPPGPVDLNRATAEQLDTLPGVGPATAAAILAYREQHGRFGSVEELLEVRGIGDAKLEQLRPLVTV